MASGPMARLESDGCSVSGKGFNVVVFMVPFLLAVFLISETRDVMWELFRSLGIRQISSDAPGLLDGEFDVSSFNVPGLCLVFFIPEITWIFGCSVS